MKTIFVVGASGFFGSNIVQYFRKKHRVIAGFNRHIIKYPGVTHVTYNFNDRDYMKRLLQRLKPDTIIYCAGINDFVECARHPQYTESVNGYGPVFLSAAADTLPHRFIYLSTSYVYDGKKGNFSEPDVVLPDTHYAKGKLAGENYVRSKCLNYTILRLSPVFGVGTIYHPSIYDKLRMSLERGHSYEMAQNEVHSFLSMNIALKAIEWILIHESKNTTYNLGGLTKVSWYEFGLAVAESLGFNKDRIVPGKSQFEADVDFSLNGSEIVRQLEINPLVLEEGLDLLKQQLIR